MEAYARWVATDQSATVQKLRHQALKDTCSTVANAKGKLGDLNVDIEDKKNSLLQKIFILACRRVCRQTPRTAYSAPAGP